LILLNDFKRQWAETGADVMEAVEMTGSSGWYILGQSVRAFECALAAYWQRPHAIGVASGLDAIELALRALGCGLGDFVLTSPISAFATPLAIIKTGATPVFADCDGRGLIDLEACRRILEQRPEIRYFAPVHLFGHSLDLNLLRELRETFQLRLVEDCAQSIGAKWGQTLTGSIGQYAATSFYPTKNLGALGDGGAVLADNENHAAIIRRLRDYGQSSKYVHDVLGYNSRLDEIQASILNTAFLPRLAGWLEARRRIAKAYLEGIHSPALTQLGVPQDSNSCWHLFPLLVEAGRKTDAIAFFNSKGISIGEHYPLALVEQPALAYLKGKWGSDCQRAIEFCHREISLPIHPYMTGEEIATVISACNAWI
jgi:dTDP-4-amino-4,6-dideoxygalactose transaminase